MLFNSYIFIFVFLPAVLAGFVACSRAAPSLTVAYLLVASLAFYTWWLPAHVVLLLSSILFNYAIGRELLAIPRGDPRRKRLLAAAVAANLVLLGVFKYVGVALDSIATLSGDGFESKQRALPLGISFFTFTQIAYLIDLYRSEAREYRFADYGLFVAWFPHLMAGPIMHHREMMPQFAQVALRRLEPRNVALGLTVFAFGLFKKVIVADAMLSPHADAVFNAVAHGNALPLIESWLGASAFGLQIYFDFSGYSDMAIGLSLLFGIRLPLNFHSPYKAESIIDFWRRWHMTLSRFLRNYLYIPLGGNRGGPFARYRNLMVTMLLGGLWHGAGWTFVVWGGLHGVCLVANHLWRARFGGRPPSRYPLLRRALCWMLTFAVVTLAWAFFRADGFGSALLLTKGMLGLHGAPWPVDWLARWDVVRVHGYQASGAAMFLIAALIAVVRFAPNTQEIMGRFDIALDTYPRPASGAYGAVWRLTPIAALIAAALFAASIGKLHDVTPFLYFQF